MTTMQSLGNVIAILSTSRVWALFLVTIIDENDFYGVPMVPGPNKHNYPTVMYGGSMYSVMLDHEGPLNEAMEFHQYKKSGTLNATEYNKIIDMLNAFNDDGEMDFIPTGNNETDLYNEFPAFHPIFGEDLEFGMNPHLIYRMGRKIKYVAKLIILKLRFRVCLANLIMTNDPYWHTELKYIVHILYLIHNALWGVFFFFVLMMVKISPFFGYKIFVK